MSCQNNHIENWRWGITLALGCIIFGSKLFFLKKYSVALPFWDEWDSIGLQLLKPFKENSLSFEHLFSLHNEHRILIPRIFSLILLGANEIWDPQLLMVANAFICTATALLVYKILSLNLNFSSSVLLAIMVGIVFAVPFSWTSLLVAFQSQFFLMTLFSIFSFWMFSQCEPLGIKWALGILFSLCAYLSLASGILALPAAVGGLFIAAISSGRISKREIISMAILVTLFLLIYVLQFKDPGQGHMASKSITEFFVSLGKSLAWPYSSSPVLAILMFTPFAGMLLVMLLDKKIDAKENKFLIILGLFIVGQAVAMAYVRGAGGNSPANRYVELLIFMPLINFLALVHIFKAAQTWRFKKYFYWGALSWVFIAIMGLGLQAQLVFSQGLASWQNQSITARKNILNYLKTSDRNHLANKPRFHISHPFPDSLIKILEDETLRDIIPIAAEGTKERLRSGKLRPLAEGLMNSGQWILLLGIALLTGSLVMGGFRRDRFT